MNNVLNDIAPALSREAYVDNIVFASGITRSGKTLLMPIISSFHNSEKVNVNFFLELITALHSTKEISSDLAVYLLRSGVNLMAYDNAIGRNSNFRRDDYTSVWRYKEPMEYISRLTEDDGDRVFEKINTERRLFPLMWHNGLWHSDVLFQAFPNSKIIHMQRNPVDIVFSWIGKGYGGDFFTNKRSSDSLVYEFKGEIIPHYAHGWEERYCALDNQVDRIIHMVDFLRHKHLETYNRLNSDQKQQVLFVNFDDLTLNTDESVIKIADFLNTKVSNHTNKILKDERCPREFDSGLASNKLKEINKKASKDSFNLLMSMLEDFKTSKVSI